MTSVWLRSGPGDPRPRRASPLSRERIVEAAVALLDGSGADGLTMRRLAQSLEVTPTALYWHVDTRDDVLDLAVDHIFGDVPLPPVTDDWRADVRTLTRGWRDAMLRHPWSPGLIGRPMLGPNVLARTEFLQAALVRGGHTGVGLAVVTRLLANVVIGAAVTEATWRQASPAQRAAREKLAAGYATLTASGHLADGRWSDDDLFDRGLDAILGPGADAAPTSAC